MSSQCHYRRHLRGAKLSVYELALVFSRESGELYAGLARCSLETGYTRDTVREALKSLCREGWLVPLGGNRQGASVGGQFRPNRYRVVSHDDWGKNHPGRCEELSSVGKTPALKTPRTGESRFSASGKPAVPASGEPPHKVSNEYEKSKSAFPTQSSNEKAGEGGRVASAFQKQKQNPESMSGPVPLGDNGKPPGNPCLAFLLQWSDVMAEILERKGNSRLASMLRRNTEFFKAQSPEFHERIMELFLPGEPPEERGKEALRRLLDSVSFRTLNKRREALGDTAYGLFDSLVCASDREGRIEWNPAAFVGVYDFAGASMDWFEKDAEELHKGGLVALDTSVPSIRIVPFPKFRTYRWILRRLARG